MSTRRAPLLALSALALLALASALPVAADPSRVSTSVELRKVAPLLHRVAKLYSQGFGRTEAAQVAREIDALEVDREHTWEFATVSEKRPGTLKIRAVLDNLSMVDLDFSADPADATRIRRALDDITAK